MRRGASPATRTPGGTAVGLRRFSPRGRAILELAPDLLLVFKPRGHDEEPHAHPHGQLLQVLRGCLVVEVGGRTIRLVPGGTAFRIRARSLHATRASKDTWLVVERKFPRVRSARERRA